MQSSAMPVDLENWGVRASSKVYKSKHGYFVVRDRKTKIKEDDLHKAIEVAKILKHNQNNCKVYLAVNPEHEIMTGKYKGMSGGIDDSAKNKAIASHFDGVVNWSVAHEGTIQEL